MSGRRNRWIVAATVIATLGLGTVSALAAHAAKGEPGKKAREMGQRLAAKAGLKGEKAVQFVKTWDAAAQERREKRKELVQAMKQLATEFREAGKDKPLTRSLDRVQAAVLALVDGHGKTIESLRSTLTSEQQSRLVLESKGHRILALPGMKQAVPALVKHLRGEFLAAVPELDRQAREKLESIGESHMQERSKLLEQRLAIIEKLRGASGDGSQAAALLDQLVANGAALRETVTEQIVEVRKGVPERELARVLVALGEKVRSLRGKAKALREAASEE
ncbi:MAG: hypothetical protein HY816_21410 [Candidatus Wallbacteria bacterium]|nr:hypothetical protein [Candidatus Wallbacteria bacterium]